MATNQNFLLVAISHGYQLKNTVGSQELFYIFNKKQWISFLPQEKSSTELTFNVEYLSTVRAFDLIPKLKSRPEYHLSSGTKYINLVQCDSHRHYLDIDTTQSKRHKIQIYDMNLDLDFLNFRICGPFLKFLKFFGFWMEFFLILILLKFIFSFFEFLDFWDFVGFLAFFKFIVLFWIFCLRFFGIPFKVTKVTTKSYQGYYWTPKIAKNWPQQHNRLFLPGVISRFIWPCKSWTDARFGITQFVTPNTHVLRHLGL